MHQPADTADHQRAHLHLLPPKDTHSHTGQRTKRPNYAVLGHTERGMSRIQVPLLTQRKRQVRTCFLTWRFAVAAFARTKKGYSRIMSARGSFLRNKQPHYIYELWGDGGCLYVGITTSVGKRLTTHANTQHWWADVTSIKVDKLKHRDHALTEEAYRIDRLQPLYNFYLAEAAAGSRSGSGHGGVTFTRDDTLPR